MIQTKLALDLEKLNEVLPFKLNQTVYILYTCLHYISCHEDKIKTIKIYSDGSFKYETELNNYPHVHRIFATLEQCVKAMEIESKKENVKISCSYYKRYKENN